MIPNPQDIQLKDKSLMLTQSIVLISFSCIKMIHTAHTDVESSAGLAYWYSIMIHLLYILTASLPIYDLSNHCPYLSSVQTNYGMLSQISLVKVNRFAVKLWLNKTASDFPV